MSKIEAQKRADRIRSFRDGLRILEAEGILVLPEDQRQRLLRYHEETLRSFALNLVVLGTIFNINPSPKAFLPWAAFAFILAYAYGLRIILVAGILSLAGWLSATMGTWSGCYWLSFGERPENFLPAGALLLAIPLVPPRHDRVLLPIYRIFRLLRLFLPILVLSNCGETG